ncbi:MAG: sulfatase/phosphatase domain-containing protein, partial [Candidatus Limnocylindria bacterium]
DEDIAEPETFNDDYQGRSTAAAEATMRIARHLTRGDLKQDPPPALAGQALKKWKYQRYIKDYLRCVAGVDDSVGKLLEYLDAKGLKENTLVIYSSDQGFFLGDHGWYDKRFMYEESLRMPLLVRYPREVSPGTISDAMVLNVDFAQTFCDLAGVEPTRPMQGRSLRPILRGRTPDDWRTGMYYRYWMHLDGSHGVWAHRGVRTDRYKLVHYYGEALDQPGATDEPRPEEWELFDLEADPFELHSLHDDPSHASLLAELRAELARLVAELGDVAPAGDPRARARQAAS